MNEQTPVKLTGTVLEAAKLMKIGRNKAYDMVNAGLIPTLPREPGKQIIVKWRVFLRMLEGEG